MSSLIELISLKSKLQSDEIERVTERESAIWGQMIFFLGGGGRDLMVSLF